MSKLTLQRSMFCIVVVVVGFLMSHQAVSAGYVYSDSSRQYVSAPVYSYYTGYAACANECNIGDHQCSGTSGRICTNYANCALWSNYESCDSRCYSCGDGSCDSACGESQTSCPRDCGYSTDQLGSNNGRYGNGNRNYNQANTSNGGCSQAPNAYAGADKEVYDGGSVRLEGSTDGNYNRVSWTCTGGTLSNSGSLQPTWSFANNNYNYYEGNGYSGTYTCTMTVYNSCGSKSDSMVIRTRGNNRYDGSSQYSNDNYGANMKVALIASPNSGCGAAYGVDLTATITNYGSYNGGYTYYFDCNNDGTWEKIANTSDSTYDAYNLCNYVGAGSYTARVRVETQGRTLTDTEIIHTNNCGNGRAYPSAPVYPVVPCPTYPVVIGSVGTPNQVAIQKTVSNLSDGTQYSDSVQAQPLEVLSYKIVLTGSSGYSTNVIVRDALPAGITAARDLRVDGVSNGGNIQSGINIGNLPAGQTRIITYTVSLAGQGSFGYGRTTITNAASVYADGGQSASASAIVYVSRSGIAGATGVSTGFDSNAFAQFVLLAAAISIGSFLLIKKISGGRKMEIVTGGARRVEFAL